MLTNLSSEQRDCDCCSEVVTFCFDLRSSRCMESARPGPGLTAICEMFARSVFAVMMISLGEYRCALETLCGTSRRMKIGKCCVSRTCVGV